MGMQTLEFWVEMLCRRWTVALQVGLLAFLIVALGSVLLPPTYQSDAKVLVESNRAQLLVSPGLQQDSPSAPSASITPVNEQDLNSEVELLSSPYLIRQALSGVPDRTRSGLFETGTGYLEACWLCPRLAYGTLHGVPNMTAHEEWANKIEAKLSTTVIKRSNVIEVDFRSHDPQWSAEFLTLLLSRYLELHARISNNPQAEKFFEAQRQLLEQRLNRAEENLRAPNCKPASARLSAQQQALITQLYAAQADYRKTTAQLSAATELIANLRHKRPPHRSARPRSPRSFRTSPCSSSSRRSSNWRRSGRSY